MKDIENKTRRDFLAKLGMTAGLTVFCASALPFLSSCENDQVSQSITKGLPVSFDASPYLKIDPKSKFPFINLKNIGCGIIKAFEGVNYGIPFLIIKIGEHIVNENGTDIKVPNFVCFSSMCTHNNCLGREDIASSKILPSKGQVGENRYIVCSCHGSQFDAFNDAKVVTGPADKPLIKYSLDYDYNTKIITIKEKITSNES